jgi:hypothetical protein
MAQSKRELEDVWRERLREARLKYEEAAKAFKATWGEHFESRLTSDPTHAIQQARNIESRALAEYMRVLKDFYRTCRVRQSPPGKCWGKQETIVPWFAAPPAQNVGIWVSFYRRRHISHYSSDASRQGSRVRRRRTVRAIADYFAGFGDRPFEHQRRVLRAAFQHFVVEQGAIPAW